ncbi:GD10898 [Drosophila simulans]|uniref:GD10898 n=1 Tax=Drosophila simulans TaxID=7240 RepID=B4QDD0_DROSI|nr:GD10898 [Drosophila simulans]
MRLAIIRVFCTIILSLEICGESITRHTNVKCEVLDKSFAEFSICKLNVLGRGIIAENVYIKMLKLPIQKISVNFAVYKKLSGYHPFLFNVTVDFCHYMKHPNPMNIFHYFYTAVKPYSNFNHSCPYNHDILVKDFVLTDQMFAKIPLPTGNYMFSIKLATDNVWRAVLNTYFDVNVEKKN